MGRAIGVIRRGSAIATEEPAQVRGVVVGLAQATGASWSVTHSAEAIPVGALEPRRPRELGRELRLIPGVQESDLTEGWLVFEHVLDAPESEAPGGTAWTYAHAQRGAFLPLAQGFCHNAR